ncbi:beta-galactosidase trimerization domain-containing protein [Paenibacillus dokdonensis]|uniref:Beta-galactosidase trimerization domain-containing protein n=1 Tax=Paenibacillus dokdonensis TaxID=2567944 RepID=A0ABU6GUC6_9BACL|nr:beta-galactosidase trimerization domain-containing protein [Paenibacillus dokdonensis]MEC0241931.1 beta-galactosidase trimerization domain-containing protein [Paenibacillus dokdonensis]
MRFRQVHLDFHTSEAIDHIGSRFEKEQFQQMLKLGHVDSITIFSKCHHGWAYNPSKANLMHPGLSFDLLGAMIEAAHEIGVKTPVYLSAGLDEQLAVRHPEWCIRPRYADGEDLFRPGYHQLCMNTPYLGILLSQIAEVVQNYDADGIFLDIVGVRECYCASCTAAARARGIDPRDIHAMRPLWEETYANYTNQVFETVNTYKPGLPIFHNGGHIRRGRRDLARMNTHLELESLPTGGWGYDHFPLSARYAQPLGMPFLGMTGKFHTTWGEFGGYKHPNALRYETALSLAHGAACSIGDQLHPLGQMDEATYRLIGRAFAEVEAKEEWCKDAVHVADVALLSVEAAGSHTADGGHDSFTGQSDAGAVRMLVEGNILFDVIDLESDFESYQVIILPDYVRINEPLQSKLHSFLDQGGRLLVTGESGLQAEADTFALDLGVKHIGINPYQPDYYRPLQPLDHLGDAAFIFYSTGQKVELTESGTELGKRENPYFNRDAFTFCSHQHTPDSGDYGGPGMVESADGIYIAWNVFEDYATKGSLALKETVLFALSRLLPQPSMRTALQAQGSATLQKQADKSRYVQHTLYASPVKRGDGIEIIEDILPVYNIAMDLRIPEKVQQVYLAPQMTPLDFTQKGDRVMYTIPELECHQMVVLAYEKES